MQREDLRKLAVETADSIIDGFSNTVRRAAGLFASPEEALDKLIIPEINSTLGVIVGRGCKLDSYKGEVRDIARLFGHLGWIETIHKISEMAKEEKVHGIIQPGDYILIPLDVPEIQLDGYKFNEVKAGTVKLVVTYVFINGVVFNFEDILFCAPMNTKNTNKGGFVESLLAKYLNDHFMQYVFAPVKDCLKPNKDGLRISLPTYAEVFGENNNYSGTNWGDDSARHPYFAKCTNRIKVQIDNRDNTCWYWLSTPTAAHSAHFCYVGSDGGAAHDATDWEGGVAPAFCVA